MDLTRDGVQLDKEQVCHTVKLAHKGLLALQALIPFVVVYIQPPELLQYFATNVLHDALHFP
jgi:hypothetical protein